MTREVTPNDFEQIYELGSTLHENFRNTYNLSELITNSYFKILVFEKESKIRGFLMYSVLYSTIDVLDIIVEEKFRNQKIASILLDYMITNSTPGGRIYLEVAVNNEPAIHLYEKFGFKIIHTRKKYYGTLDGYVMERVNEYE